MSERGATGEVYALRRLYLAFDLGDIYDLGAKCFDYHLHRQVLFGHLAQALLFELRFILFCVMPVRPLSSGFNNELYS